MIPTPGEIKVYPNPYCPARAVGGTLKIIGLEPTDIVRIYTLTSEKVFEASGISGRLEWDGKNREGSPLAVGVYIWVIQQDSGVKHIGKLFIVN